MESNADSVVWSGRPTLLFMMPSIAVASFLVIILLLMGTTIDEFDSGIRSGLIGFSLFVLLILAVKILVFKSKKYVITEKRVYSEAGIIAKSVSEVRAKDIRGIKTNQSISERIFGIGSIVIGSAATAGEEVRFEGIRGVKKITECIRHLQDQYE